MRCGGRDGGGQVQLGGAARRPVASGRDDPAAVGAGPRPAAGRTLADAGTSSRRARNGVDGGGAALVGAVAGRRARRPGTANAALAGSDLPNGAFAPSTAPSASSEPGSGAPPSGPSGSGPSAPRPLPDRAVRLRFVRAVQRLVEGLLVHPRLVERVAPAPVRQRQPGRRAHVLLRTASAPRHAACAAAARAMTRSARIPSTSKAAHTAAIRRSSASGSTTDPSRTRASAIRRAVSPSASANAATNAAGSASNAIRLRTTSTRVSTSRDARTSTVSPNRSSSCGRSSPSSGFMVPTSRNDAACDTDTPSRSTCARPIAAASRSRSTRWSCSRLTSSTYSTPRCASASSPGW